MHNQAAYMTAVRKTEIRDCEMPVLKPGCVLLEMAYVGICGSDVHFYETGQRKGAAFQLPFILGHEASAVVMDRAPDVTALHIGDQVTIEPQQTCGACEFCKSGRYNMCPSIQFPSVPPYDGMLRRYFAFPAHLCHVLPPNVSLLEGALAEPFAVGLYAARRGDVHLGQTVAILGMGAIGLMTIMACKAMGASRIIAIDLLDNRLAYAQKAGATDVINAGKQDAVKAVGELTHGLFADVVFETAGSRSTAAMTCQLLKRCGIIVLVGNINGETAYPFMDLMYREGEIRTIYRYRNNFPVALEEIASGAVDLAPMVSGLYPFAQTGEAFDRAINDKNNIVKLVVDMHL